jgi:uncharacterized protein (AIM24 family)
MRAGEDGRVTSYLCRYCRQASDLGQAVSCRWCGAPIDVRLRLSESGWMEQPMISSMTRLSCGKTDCQIAGSYVPVAEFGLPTGEWMYFSPQVLLWSDAFTTLTLPSQGGGGMMEARGPGHVGVSENRAGRIIAIPLQRRQRVRVRQGRFLCATGSVDYRWEPSNVRYLQFGGSEWEFEYPMGRYHLTFTGQERQGLLLLHARGDTFIRDLADGESILVRPASLLYWEDETDFSLHLEYAYVPGKPSRRRLSRSSTIWLRVRGPGRLVMQSAYERSEDAGAPDYRSFPSWHRWPALAGP